MLAGGSSLLGLGWTAVVLDSDNVVAKSGSDAFECLLLCFADLLVC